MKTRTVALSLFALALIAAFALDPLVIRSLSGLPSALVIPAKKLTALGNGAWLGIGLPVLMLIAALVEVSARSPKRRQAATTALRLAMSLFLLILISGIVVQLLKHLFGRGRPEHFAEIGAYSFHPLPMSFTYNSFPSGHATTLGALALFLCWLFPARRGLFLILAALFAATRVIVGSHYPSDVLAGLGLGAATTWLLGRALLAAGLLPARSDPVYRRLGAGIRGFGRRVLRHLSWGARASDPLYNRLLVATLIALNLGMIVFLAEPEIDIAASRLFYDPVTGFELADNGVLNLIRYALMRAVQLVAVVALIGSLLSFRLGARLRLPRRVYGYVAAGFVLGPILLVNGIFKEHWGRARPADIGIFGGDRVFTLPFQRAHECLSNCSFPSGEGAGIAMTAILLGSLCWPWLRGRSRAVQATAFGITGFGIALRVAMGRHYLSDSIFAVLLMAAIALVLYRWCDIGACRPVLGRQALLQDLGTARHYLFARPRPAEPSLAEDLLRLLRALLRIIRTGGAVLKAMSVGLRAQIRTVPPARPKSMRLEPGE